MAITDSFVRLAGRFASPGGPNGHLTILFYHRVLTEQDPLTPEI